MEFGTSRLLKSVAKVIFHLDARVHDTPLPELDFLNPNRPLEYPTISTISKRFKRSSACLISWSPRGESPQQLLVGYDEVKFARKAIGRTVAWKKMPFWNLGSMVLRYSSSHNYGSRRWPHGRGNGFLRILEGPIFDFHDHGTKKLQIFSNFFWEPPKNTRKSLQHKNKLKFNEVYFGMLSLPGSQAPGWGMSTLTFTDHGCVLGGGFTPITKIYPFWNLTNIWVFSIINHPFWGFSPYFWKHPYTQNTQHFFWWLC